MRPCCHKKAVITGYLFSGLMLGSNLKEYLVQKRWSHSSLIFLAALLLALSGRVAAQNGPDSLNILVYGASGKVGSYIVDEALNRNHRVTAVSRDPSSITKVHDNLVVVQGDLLNPASVASLVAGQDVVIVSVRGRIGRSKDPNDTISRIGAGNVVQSLRQLNDDAPRYIHVGGSGTLEVRPGVLYADTLPKIFIPKYLETEIYGQVLTLQFLRTVTDVRWTYATPAKNFTNGKRTGIFRLGGDQLLENSHGRSRISRADFAVAVIDEAEKADFVRARFSVAY
jgi:putative NADH-flavin reductase